MITINLENTYEPTAVSFSREITVMEFLSPQRDGNQVLVKVEIVPHPDILLPTVYNLAMGPLNPEGQIDDTTRLNHSSSDVLFSTIILFSIAFLNEYPDLTIGLDGSDDLRATLYHSMFLLNRNHLSEYIVCIGVDWYVKLLRNREQIERTDDGLPFFKPRPEPFDYTRSRRDLYRYYIIELNN